MAISASNEEVYPEQFLLNQKAYLDRLCALHHHGLSLANVLVLIRTWSQGASIHILRHVVVTKEWADLVDAQLTAALEYLLDVPMDQGRKMQVFLKIKDGGLGFGSAVLRREAAYIGAWEGGMQPLLHHLSTHTCSVGPPVSTVHALRRIWPKWGLRIDDLETS